MKIDSSVMQFQSQHASMERRSVTESLRFWSGDRRPDFEGTQRANPASTVSISDAAKGAQSSDAQAIQDSAEEANKDPKIQLILRMVEAFTGIKVRLVRAEDLQSDPASQQHLAQVQQAGARSDANAPPAPPQRAGWGMEYDYHESVHEIEQTSFSAQGVIRTADGREINFELQLSMQREFYSETNISLHAGDAVRKDPLVINFDGNAAQLTDTKFAFDIDSDGRQDNISFVAPGSGFLALDLNRNGKVDNGSELFGTASGDGFADLTRYDSDGNRWIDENDAVYNDLKIWRKDAEGKDSLSSLMANKVGALYLGSAATPFSVNDAGNAQLGQVRSSGIYLNENGGAGTLQQIDLNV